MDPVLDAFEKKVSTCMGRIGFTGDIRMVETVFNPDKNLKTGLPGRPRKIRIILKNHIRSLRSMKKHGYLPENITDPFIRCFYEILMLCCTKQLVYRCWPSMSLMKTTDNIRKEERGGILGLLHKVMFR